MSIQHVNDEEASIAGSTRPRATSERAEELEGQHKFELTEAEVQKIFTSSLYREVIASDAFQRLKKIHFLGSLDYVVDPQGPKPNKRHTRYQHSLGVARLALQFSRDRSLQKRDEEISVVSALLHDIGHAPLSHSLESVFKDEFDIGHHIIGERIVKGDAPLGDGLHRTLRRWNINAFEVMAVIEGKGSGIHRELFNYAINIDTIEAIIRSSTYIFRTNLHCAPSDVLLGLLTLDTGVLDAFWRLKDEVYSKLIQHRTGLLADFVCQHYMRNSISEFERESYYFTESDLEGKHPRLFDLLRKLRQPSFQDVKGYLVGVETIPVVRRRFIVDKLVKLENLYRIDERYKQTRIDDVFRL